MPGKKKKYNSRFPPARIKKIMQSDEEVGKVAAPVPVIISRALELFVQSLLTHAGEVTTARHARTLTPSHLKQCIISEHRFDFLQDLFSSVPDITMETDGETDPSLLITNPSEISFSSKENDGFVVSGKHRGRRRGRRPLDPEATKAYRYKRLRGSKRLAPPSPVNDDDDDSEDTLELDIDYSDLDESDSEKVSPKSFNNSVESTEVAPVSGHKSIKRLSTDGGVSSLPGGIQISIPCLPTISIPPHPQTPDSAPCTPDSANVLPSMTPKGVTCVPVPVITSVAALNRSLSKVEVDEDYDC